jgi:hypothetical protein
MKDRIALYFVWVEYEGKNYGHAIAVVDHPDGTQYVFDNGFNEIEMMRTVAWRYKEIAPYPKLREIQRNGTEFVFVERRNA